MSSHSNENIVKNLFLPSYTNSGSNAAYEYEYENDNGTSENGDYNAVIANDNDARPNLNTSTENKGKPLSVSNAPFQYDYGNHHVEEYDGSQIGGYAPTNIETPVSVTAMANSQRKDHSQSTVERNEKSVGEIDFVPPDDTGEEEDEDDYDGNDRKDLHESKQIESNIDIDLDMDTKSMSMSTAVNTGTGSSRAIMHPYLNEGKGGDKERALLLPRTPKNDHLLSPPSVMRKIPEMEMNITTAANYNNPFRDKMNKERNDDKRYQDDDDETSSMVSQYGSDVGDVKLRLDEVKGMEAVTEEQEDEDEDRHAHEDQDEEESKNDDGGQGINEQETNFLDVDPMNMNGHGHSSSSIILRNDSGLSFDNDDQRQTKINHGHESTCDGQDQVYDYEDDSSQGYTYSVTSVDLTSQHETASSVHGGGSINGSVSGGITYEYTHFQPHSNIHLSSPKKSARNRGGKGPIPALPEFTPLSSVTKESYTNIHAGSSSIPPKSPMGAVSAALRRFGNGFGSNMSRCTHPTNMPSMEKHSSGTDAGNGTRVNICLSPRFRREPPGHIKPSIQQPIFGESQSQSQSQRSQINVVKRRPRIRKTGTERAAAASQLLGITNCLSFDPESGRKPYANMRMTSDSPPPLPPGHRKTRSWGSVHSGDFFMNIGKDILVGDNPQSQSQRIEIPFPQSPGKRGTQVPFNINSNQCKATATPKSSAFNSDGVVGRMMEGLLSPKGKDKMENFLSISPKRRNSMASSTTPPRSELRKTNQHFTPSNRSIVVLRSPQRVDDVEHEDALDLLALLVERSVSFQGTSELPKSKEADKKPCLSIEECVEDLRKISRQYEEHEHDDDDKTSHETRMIILNNLEKAHTYATEMKQAALSASTWLHAIGRSGESSSESRRDFNMKNNKRVVLSTDELMKMGTKQLASIVQNIELQLMDKNELNNRLDNELSKCRAEIGRLKTTSRTENSFLAPDKSILDEEAGDDSTATTSVGGNEFPENSEINIDVTGTTASKMNEESKNTTCLADAKKEILLLKAELEEANKMLRRMERDIKWPSSKGNAVQEECTESDNGGIEIDHSVDRVHQHLTKEEENETVQQETEEISSDDADDDCSTNEIAELKEDPTDANAPSVLKDVLQEELKEYVAAVQEADRDEIRRLKQKIEVIEKKKHMDSDPDNKMIHVRMLDAENFVTDWDSLGPLPPPPHHDLRSPIVHDLLSQWTSESKTQESLLQWVESIMNGEEPSNVPPLQLSGLDHQVRDGFTMHILPFLFRRSDIHVEVTTRAHRRTSYDVSVTIRGSQPFNDGSISFGSQQHSDGSNHVHMNLAANKPHMMAFKATAAGGSLETSTETTPVQPEKGLFKGYYSGSKYSDANGSPTHSEVTTPISNHAINSSQLSRLTRTGDTHPSDDNLSHLQPLSEDFGKRQSQQQSGGIVAGAWKSMGDLLSRRKAPSNDEYSFASHKERSNYASSQSPIPEDEAEQVEAEEDSQPYHRVVSAPPGKIGITFVQYRGHAMVSDVYNDSPLSGWVFPSDILIAVDEVPVSGMRVPEIVELLTQRKERQRALRVISSHAMTELLITEDSGALMDG